MYDQLKTMMPHADKFYGPVTKEQAFNVPYNSYAVPIGNNWYIGVNESLEEHANLLIEKPADSTPADPTP